jgi:hypothetical protein
MNETWRKPNINKAFREAENEGFERFEKMFNLEKNSSLSTHYYYYYNGAVFQNTTPPHKNKYLKETTFVRNIMSPEQVTLLDLYNEYDEKLYSGKFYIETDPRINGERQFLTTYSIIPGIMRGDRVNPMRIVFKLLVKGKSEAEMKHMSDIAEYWEDNVTLKDSKRPDKDELYEAEMSIIEGSRFGVPVGYSSRKKKLLKSKSKRKIKKPVKKSTAKPAKKVVRKIKRK